MADNSHPEKSRRSILKASGAIVGGGALMGAATSSASASDLYVGQEVYLNADGRDIPGWESCDLKNYEFYNRKTSGTIVDGCSRDGYWKVDLDGYPTAWFSDNFLSENNGGP
ncbi:hypothetical protein [Halorussus pelagicus]|uniref:hypothetical protein n=1 Tax=Halorussus pelagicus TaxID=2505977 RepID=UPI000FFBD3C8|nr:hypothetical protein [Halorussus pelagicus]